jgi:hypothetical protein
MADDRMTLKKREAAQIELRTGLKTKYFLKQQSDQNSLHENTSKVSTHPTQRIYNQNTRYVQDSAKTTYKLLQVAIRPI